MRSENFVAFFTISGFFIGLSFSLVKSQSITEFILFLMIITFFFYLFIHLVLIFFFSVEPNIKDSFNKAESESLINLQVKQLHEKESVINEITSSIKELKY